MRMYDLIEKKKRGHALDKAEICWMIQSYTAGQIPDYQMAAFLMAVYFQGMDLQETTEMTLAMAHSGQMADLSGIAGVKVDKHSTGGVGDKTTLIAAPMAAACGIPIAKMSGRGLGFTGGTVDKLESIPGYRTVRPREEFFEIVNEVGISLIGQSGEMAVADKKIYALRDVTATVDSLPLIASSIMSKKIAAGADAILLDVKTGSGAFMKTREQSAALARTMVGIGNRAGRRTAALITDMDTPLGDTAGNAIEVQEAIWTLRGKGPADLTELCIHLAGNMLWLAGQGEPEDCLRRAAASLQDGSAYRCFYRMVQRQTAAAEQEIVELERQRDALKGTVRLLKEADSVNVSLSDIQPEKTLTGAVKGVTVDQVEQLKKMALRSVTDRHKVKELTEENTRLRSQVPSMKKRMEEAQQQQRLEQENRRLREENSYLQYELEEERSFSERLTDGIGRLLDYLEERLPERLLPLLEKARELLPNPEIGRQQEQQQHQRGMGGMEL